MKSQTKSKCCNAIISKYGHCYNCMTKVANIIVEDADPTSPTSTVEEIFLGFQRDVMNSYARAKFPDVGIVSDAISFREATQAINNLIQQAEERGERRGELRGRKKELEWIDDNNGQTKALDEKYHRFILNRYKELAQLTKGGKE